MTKTGYRVLHILWQDPSSYLHV